MDDSGCTLGRNKFLNITNPNEEDLEDSSTAEKFIHTSKGLFTARENWSEIERSKNN